MVTPRSVHAFKLLLTAWFIVSHTEAFSFIPGEPNDLTVKEARCYANCFTLHASYNNDSEKICETAACQECLHPCGKQFSDNRDCINRFCSNSTACNASCRFLTVLNSLPSSALRDGDGSKPMQPGKPNVTDMNITSVSLQWTPVSNTSETPVYVIGTSYTGDAFSFFPLYFSKILTTPRATLTVEQLCALTLFGSSFVPGRSSFNGVYYTFQIAVLTENSSLSFGPYSTAIIFPKPKPVTNVTVTSLEYDARQIATRRIALNALWIQPDEEKHIISKYTMVWDDIGLCTQETPLTAETTGPQPNGAIFFNEELLKCTHTLKVYALVGCTASAPTTITYEYPGCLNITDFPRDICSRVDPSATSREDRQVSNISYRIVAVSDDYNFNVSVTWEPPVYHFLNVTHYFLQWGETGNFFADPNRDGASTDPRQLLVNVPPARNYTVFITAYFEDDKGNQLSVENIFNFPTPEPTLEETVVQNLAVGAFIEDDKNITYSVQFKWEHPLFNKSRVANYSIAYKLSGYSSDDLPCRATSCRMIVNEKFFNISGILPREFIDFKVTPVYLNKYIKGSMRDVTDVRAPEPSSEETVVQNLVAGAFIEDDENITYSVQFKWEHPLFSKSRVANYSIAYKLSGYTSDDLPCRTTSCTMIVNETFFDISGILPRESIHFEITPAYVNEYINGQMLQTDVPAPEPPREKSVVQNLVARFIEDDESSTYSVHFKWEHPLFNYIPVVNYSIAYKVSGYSRDDLPCRPTSCSMIVNETFFDISGILPRESIHFEITPAYLNDYVNGQMLPTDVKAPEPKDELMKVVGLNSTKLVFDGSSAFRTTVKWQKPLFTHSDVKFYSYNISVTSNKNVQERRRRATETVIRKTTSNTNVTIDGIQEDVEYTFKVKPVFTVEVLSGRDATLAIFKDPPVVPTPKASSKLTAGEVGGLVVGLLLLILIALCLVVWCYRTSRQKRGLRDNGLLGSRNEWMIDDWEVDGGMVSLDKEVGEGAFGKVYQGFLQKLPASSRQLSFKPTMDSTRKSTMKQSDGLTVAVKMLHNMADTDQRREFLEEIQLMKDVGCHRNIINMIGCCTIEEPMFLLVEYVPYGDLLHYLRKHRGKLKDYLGDDSRGAYRSTYCETYFTDATSGGISVKATKSDRLYVNTPEMQKEDNGNIQILSFKSSNSAGETGAGNNRGSTGDVFYVNSLAIQESENDSQESTEAEANAEEEEDDESEETLTPGDLMAFAWQISQGMEYLAKKGFIHRDLAARNVLVGEKKIAKVADFGLTRHVYEEKVYHAKHNRKLPLKWMSIEAVFDETFTSQSDVWAFGIVLWELVTLGGTPYPSINNRELLKLLKEGYRMEKPEICNDEFYDLMTDCWKEIPTERPTFALIRARMEEMMQKDNPYLDFSALDESKEYYQVASFNSLMEESTDDELSSKTDEDLLNMEGELMSEESLEDSNLSESMKKLEDKKIRETFDRVKDLTIKNNHCRIDAEDPKDAQITMNDIEMNLYRPGKRGLVL